MSAAERRYRILILLCERRHDTCVNLATELGVTSRTIQNDIQILSCSYPIETVRGRHNGGIKVADWFTLNETHLTPAQADLLKRIRNYLHGNDLHILNSILVQFGTC